MKFVATKNLEFMFIMTLILFLILISCNQKNQVNHEKSTSSKDSLFLVTDNDSIIGKWQMCSNMSDGIVTQRNICLEIEFGFDGTGFVEYPSKEKEKFGWKFMKEKLVFYYPENTKGRTFDDISYSARISNKKPDLILEIYDNEKKNVFYLLK